MGAHAVSGLQLPSPESDETFDAGIHLKSKECLRTETSVRFKYLSIDDDDDDENDKPRVQQRKKKDEGEEEDKVQEVKKGHDPIKWFGVLVPQTLRQAQASFKRAAEVAVEAHNVQAEIAGVVARQKFLERTKGKMEKKEEEE